MWPTILVYVILLIIGGAMYLLTRKAASRPAAMLQNWLALVGLGAQGSRDRNGLRGAGLSAGGGRDRRNAAQAALAASGADELASTGGNDPYVADERWTEVEETLDSIYQEFYGGLKALEERVDLRLRALEETVTTRLQTMTQSTEARLHAMEAMWAAERQALYRALAEAETKTSAKDGPVPEGKPKPRRSGRKKADSAADRAGAGSEPAAAGNGDRAVSDAASEAAKAANELERASVSPPTSNDKFDDVVTALRQGLPDQAVARQFGIGVTEVQLARQVLLGADAGAPQGD
ncbi:hypothetical protein JI721_00310 [Alicyclobacillus cycloheptanicus]|uniref:Uncharacterized protein n=1 Tax=Alicyclobacillus cycloheptanicus TaxID=1457 RepID=A0ABT9XJQ3_9BACL|nr:hypothetical protein [Alicyclobacillus cycloheptanicus]MDQ0190537.1 hypothetical protein [Alicyclobacillus cycloheptanicus]WDM01380.1 hypothetical protein JI721_00310 [Alicyclobacillus cycloheptanicus]